MSEKDDRTIENKKLEASRNKLIDARNKAMDHHNRFRVYDKLPKAHPATGMEDANEADKELLEGIKEALNPPSYPGIDRATFPRWEEPDEPPKLNIYAGIPTRSHNHAWPITPSCYAALMKHYIRRFPWYLRLWWRVRAWCRRWGR